MKKVIIITGASRGIGAATARLAVQQGYAVCVNYLRDIDAANHVVDGSVQVGGSAIAVAADVSSEADVTRIFATVDQSLGRVDALVNNAAINAVQMRVESMDAERLARVFAVNVTGSFLSASSSIFLR